jgi:hypothetical protein
MQKISYTIKVHFPTINMTESLKLIIITHLAIAVLILPSSAFMCNCSGKDLDCGNFSSQCEAQTCYEYCKSLGKDDFYNLDGNYGDGTVCGNRPGPYCYPPVAYDSNVTINEYNPVEITLNATDPDSDTITYSIGSGPSNGTLGTIIGNTVVYTPDVNYTGEDSFSFRVHDGNLPSKFATVTVTIAPNCSPYHSHAFYGNLTIYDEPAPEYTMVVAAGPGVRSNITGNPVAVETNGSFGSADNTTQKLIVQGCIEDGAPIAFFVNGVAAEVYDFNTSGPWQSSYPFSAGGVTNLNIRVPPPTPPPDDVYIKAIGVTISNSTYGFSQTINLEKNPWIELKVTGGVFDILISATGYHQFRDAPVFGRYAILGIYEHGNPVSPEIKVPFGSKKVSYAYVPTETRTFDILIYVNESPEIQDVKHLTIYVVSGPDRYNITATAGSGGSIFPAGQVLIDSGAAQRFDVNPSYGYLIADVTVDGQAMGAITGYTFSNVLSDHQIHATFTEAPHYTIIATGGSGGSISPAGQVSVVSGAAQRFDLTPSYGYQIADVTVDSQSKGAITSYTFSHVHSDHQIHATFAEDPQKN